MENLRESDITHPNGQSTHYYEGGSSNGIPLIFIHGWPIMAEVWKHQLKHFTSGSACKYRVIALDMRGYGGSSSSTDKRAYSLSTLVSELVDFAKQLGITKAVWVGHDWGCGVVNSLAAHHPELFLGLAIMCVPYRTLELGLNHLVSLVNRDIYPIDEYPYGQWEYMVYYERHTDESIKSHERFFGKIMRAFCTPSDSSSFGKPVIITARALRHGGPFGGHPEALPDVPLEHTFMDQSLYNNMMASHEKHGLFPPTAYYLNHNDNAEFAKSEKNGGKLYFPVLYIDARYDGVCSASTSPKAGEVQRAAIKDLTYETVEAGHWVQLEQPDEVNKVLETWLDNKIKRIS